MANRRYGGGNRFSGNNYSMPVNPWLEGMPPDSKKNNYTGMNSGFSQLSNPQAQLALAITNLLRPQQQQQPQQPPSLLALPQINLGNRHDFQSSSYDRNNRLHDNRRNRNKNNRNSRQGELFKRQKNKTNDRRKSSGTGYRTTVLDKSASKAKDATDKTPDGQSEKKEEEKDGKEKTDEDNKNEGDPDQKTNDEEVENGSEDKDKDMEMKNGNVESNDEKGENKDGEKSKDKNGKYGGIPARLLKCGVCEKNMWDGESFEKHLRGRAHKQMMLSVEDSYKLKANMIREEIRLAEEKKVIELNRMRRLGRKVSMQKENHCNMCDYKYIGHSTLHRKSEGHQRLKMFLHPRCKQCRTEFSTRIDWESHRLSSEHLRKVAEQQAHYNGSGAMDILSDSMNEGDETKEDVNDAESSKEAENLILDITEDMDISDLKTRLPSYKSTRSVGTSLIKEVSGFQCSSCNKFFLTQELAIKHTRTIPHYDKFVGLIRKKENAEKEKQRANEKRQENPVSDDENEGNWKRRKLNPNDNVKTENNDESGQELYDPLACNDDDDDVEITDSNIQTAIKQEELSIENAECKKENVEEGTSVTEAEQSATGTNVPNEGNDLKTPKEEVPSETGPTVTTRRTRNQRRGGRF